MVFQFEHMDVDSDGENKWTDKKMDLRKMKEVLTRWEKGLEGIAWNSLFWENHDQPRFRQPLRRRRQISRSLRRKCWPPVFI